MPDAGPFIYVGAFLLILSIGGMVMNAILGPDYDLTDGWLPGDKPRWRR